MKTFSLALVLVFSISAQAQKKNSYKKLPPKIPATKIEKAVEVPVVNPEPSAPLVESVQTLPENRASEKFMSFRMNPVILVLGSVDAALDFKINDHWQVGPQLLLMNLKISDVEFANQGGGLRATWTVEKAFEDSFYLQGGLGMTRISASYTTSTDRYTSSARSNYAYFGGGYNWQWTNFNLNLGLGVTGVSVGDIQILDASQNLVRSSSIPTKTSLLFELGFAL